MPNPAPAAIVDHVLQVPMLTMDECARVRADVEAMEPLWVLRKRKASVFHTLGAASYLDYEHYFERAALFNPELEARFGWLYDRLLQTLREQLHCPVAFEPIAARPGFHIFRPNADLQMPAGNRHFDEQFQKIAWPEAARMDFSRPLSYTLSVRLPQAGGGLNLWPLMKADYDAMDEPTRRALDLASNVEYVPYEEGGLVCHSGFQLHTAAAARATPQPDDLRVTLQGHGLWCEDTWLLYW
jgi:hypothetical protein